VRRHLNPRNACFFFFFSHSWQLAIDIERNFRRGFGGRGPPAEEENRAPFQDAYKWRAAAEESPCPVGEVLWFSFGPLCFDVLPLDFRKSREK